MFKKLFAGMNYSVTGFQLVLTRKMSFYVVTYYLPSGLFVVVSWIRFAELKHVSIFLFISVRGGVRGVIG